MLRLLQKVNDVLLHYHGSGHQGGSTDNISIVLLRGLNEPFRRHVSSEVHYFIASALQHGGYHVLSDLVDVTENSGDDHSATGCCGTLSHYGLEDGQSLLHSRRGCQNLR